MMLGKYLKNCEKAVLANLKVLGEDMCVMLK